MATENDWTSLRDMLMGLDVRLAAIEGPDDWTLPSPADLAGQAGRDYLQRVHDKLESIKSVVEKATGSGIEKVKEAGQQVAGLAAGIAEQAAKVAGDVAEDMADGFKSIAGYFEESAKTVAAFSIGTVVLLLALFFALKGRD